MKLKNSWSSSYLIWHCSSNGITKICSFDWENTGIFSQINQNLLYGSSKRSRKESCFTPSPMFSLLHLIFHTKFHESWLQNFSKVQLPDSAFGKIIYIPQIKCLDINLCLLRWNLGQYSFFVSMFVISYYVQVTGLPKKIFSYLVNNMTQIPYTSSFSLVFKAVQTNCNATVWINIGWLIFILKLSSL